MAVYSVPAGRPAAVTLTVADPATGLPAALATPPTVSVTDGDGVETASGVGVPVAGSTGVYTYTIPGDALPLLRLDTFTVTWSGELAGSSYTDEDRVETAGGPGRYFTAAEIRGHYSALVDVERYPTAKIELARTHAEQRIEAVAQVSFIPRARRLRDNLSQLRYRRGGGRRTLLLPDVEIREVYSAMIDGSPFAEGDILVDSRIGGLGRLDGRGWDGDDVAIWYTHGLAHPPEPIRAAAMQLALDRLVPSNLPARATVQTTDLGGFRLSIADRLTGSTGIPEVDAVCALYGRQRPAVG